MKRTVIALAVTALAFGSAGVATAKPGNGNGAVKAGLKDMGSAPAVLGSGCSAADASAGKQTPNGFVVLNAPGKPAKGDRAGATHKLIGEVTLKNAKPNTDYIVNLATTGCGESKGTLTTNGQGNGSFSFQDAAKGAGRYYVVLVQEPIPGAGALVLQQSYASAPATVK